MLHINLETCSSTQSYLKEQLENDKNLFLKNILITTKHQTNGVGRGDNRWHHFDNAISMSCLIPAEKPFTTAPLKVGLLLTKFFKKNYNQNILLKWPNDLMTLENKKVGGIICQLLGDKILVGIGINIFKDKKHSEMEFKCDGLGLKKDSVKADDLAKEIYTYLLENISKRFSLDEWNSTCSHFNKKVEISDEFESNSGIFLGISEIGEAIISNDGSLKKILTGSLFII